MMPSSTKPREADPRPDERPELHVVAHTHWDREWYHHAARFRQRLVALVDALLDEHASPDRPFLLDGQAILLADYLAVRPERLARLQQALSDGSLEAGPWYVLADNLIPSGEALVRNLQAGVRLLSRMGADCPAVAYCPDTFGHPAALPLLAAGFGMEVAIVWRGLGGPSHPGGDTIWWTAADGSRVLAWHLPPDGYEVGAVLPLASPEADRRWAALERQLLRRSTVGVMLLPNGADHHAPQPRLDDALAQLQRAADTSGAGVQVIRSTLQRFANALLARAQLHDVPHVAGELRDSTGYTWSLQGTFATRAADKRANARLERLLLHDVEPWCALALLDEVPGVSGAGGEGRGGGDDSTARRVGSTHDGRITAQHFRALLAHAWETLLRTHPHDTLCGCSIDAVAAAMRARQRSVAAQAAGLRQDALHAVLGHDAVLARSTAVDRDAVRPIVVRNQVARAREGVAELRVVETLGDVVVGPAGAGVEQPVASPSAGLLPTGTLSVQQLRSRVTHLRRESPQHYPDDDLVRLHDVVAWVPAVGGFGMQVLRGDELAAAAPTPVRCHATDDRITMDNGLLRVEASRDGVSLRVGDRELPQLLAIESTPDHGDSYTPSLRGAPVFLHIVQLRAGAPGPLRASIIIDWRHPDLPRLRLRTAIVLDAGAPHLRIDVRGLNRTRDHRLRIHLATDIAGGVVHADAAFGPMERRREVVDEALQQRERVLPTMPLHRWVSVTDGARGATIISDGLAEAEHVAGSVAITLLRAIGELSRADLSERPGHAGWPASIPGAQSMGAFRARFGVLLHGGWSLETLDAIWRAADAVLLPLTGAMWRDLAPSAMSRAGVELRGAGLRCESIAPAQDGEGIVMRIVNGWSEGCDGALELPREDLQYSVSRLDESLLQPWQEVGAALAFSVPAHGVTTIRLRRRS